LNPGPHGPESHDVPSNGGDFGSVQFEICDPPVSPVQIWINLQPDYYMNYYMNQPLPRLPNDLLDHAQVCKHCCVITQGQGIT